MHKTIKDLIVLAAFVIAITLLVWLPHILALPTFWGLNFKEGFNTIYRNFDGLEYVIIAKTFYDPVLISTLPQSLPPDYFASHFPGYSFLIYIFAPLVGFLKSMLFVSVLSTILSAWIFYQIVKEFKLSSNPLFLSMIFLILPARWLIVHSVGSSEPTFVLFVLTTFYFLMKFEHTGKKSNLIYAGLAGLLSQITRPPGILMAAAIGLYVIWRGYKKRSLSFTLSFYPLLLIPVTLLGIFYWYSITYQDFFAYFHSGDNIHLTFPPFPVFNKNQFWVGDIWLEDIVYIYLLGLLGGVTLWKKGLYSFAFFVFTYLAAAIFVAHRDISRYVLPITPFVLIAFEKVLTSREFKIILPLILLAIYLYAQNFILANTAPIPDLEVFN